MFPGAQSLLKSTICSRLTGHALIKQRSHNDNDAACMADPLRMTLLASSKFHPSTPPSLLFSCVIVLVPCAFLFLSLIETHLVPSYTLIAHTARGKT